MCACVEMMNGEGKKRRKGEHKKRKNKIKERMYI